MGKRHDRVTDVDTGGGGAVITGVIMTALVFLGLFLIFGDQIYSGANQVDDGVNLSQLQTPGKR